MKIVNRNEFNVTKFNTMISTYNQSGYPSKFKSVLSYDDFVESYPTLTKQNLILQSGELIHAQKFEHCYVISTSGTTSEPLLLASRHLRDITEDSYPYRIREFISRYVFSPDDTVVNLLTAGCFGYNYEGMSRILESIGVTILPVGRPDVMNNMSMLLSTLRRFAANVLVGSPSGIIQIAQASIKLGIALDITKVVFVGEAFHRIKRAYIKKLWPNANFYSLLGASEIGFAAVSTPEMQLGHHLIIKDWFFLEQSEDGRLFVTDLKTPIVPIIRYQIGDKGQIIQDATGDFYLKLGARVNEEFSLAGHRIELSAVERAIHEAGLPSPPFQVTLTTTDSGIDCVTLKIDLSEAGVECCWRDSLRLKLLNIDRLAEAIKRGVALIDIRSGTDFYVTSRGKTQKLVDQRNTTSGLQSLSYP